MTFDLYLAPVTGPRPLGFGYKSSVKVTGATKLAQRFLKMLLTPTGYDRMGATAGTALASLVGSNVIDDAYVRALVVTAVNDAADQVRAIPSAAGDSRLQSATVLSTTLNADRVDVYIEILTTDGAKASIALPLDTGDRTVRRAATISTYGSALQGL